MVPKAYPEEKIGHFCLQHGRLVVIEYSDLPAALQREIDPQTGRLRYLAGSIAIHILDREFVRRMAVGGGGCGAAVPPRRQEDRHDRCRRASR